LNKEVAEKEGDGGMYIPPSPSFSGVHPALDHYKIFEKAINNINDDVEHFFDSPSKSI
jgi:hypothetical protein